MPKNEEKTFFNLLLLFVFFQQPSKEETKRDTTSPTEKESIQFFDRADDTIQELDGLSHKEMIRPLKDLHPFLGP